MIIDCHVHIAPDRIARAVAEFSERRFATKLAGSMTVDGVRESMAQCGVAISVVFNVAQRAELVKTANDFAIAITDNQQIVGLGLFTLSCLVPRTR